MSATFSALITATGTVGQIDITGGEYPVYSISNNPILPGSGSVVVPSGTTGQRLLGLGAIRLNTTTGFFECSSDNATWQNLAVGGGGIASVTGTAGQIDVTAGVNPVISIDPTYIGQASITTLGTIGTGVWAGTAVSAIHGGTSQTTYILGDTLYASAANTLSKLAGNITAGVQYLAQTGTGAVSAAPVWTTISGGDITGAALTKVDDTNVTLTLGGTPATSLLRAASITAGWAGQLSLARGGTNAALVADNGAIPYSTAGALALLASTATARQIIMSGASAAPSWSTATYPATTTINQLLYSSAANTIAGLATANSAVLLTTSAGIPVFSGTLTDGQIIIGSTGATPVAASIIAGAGVTVTPGAGTLTISATGSGGTVTSVSGTLNRITSTGGATPVIDISAAYVGQTSITTVGALAAGSLAAGFTPVTVPLGGTGIITATAYSVICAGTTATGAFQSLAALGASGTVLTSNGPGALPSFQATGTVAGTILQVVSATFTSTASSSSSTFADTGITVSITPSSITNKILVMAFVNMGSQGASNNSTYLNLVRGSTTILQGDAASSRIRVTALPSAVAGQDCNSVNISYVDSPASVAAQTYKIQFAASNNAGTVYINRSTTDNDLSSVGRGASSIIVMEVKA